jgi:hypothetical protein
MHILRFFSESVLHIFVSLKLTWFFMKYGVSINVCDD